MELAFKKIVNRAIFAIKLAWFLYGHDLWRLSRFKTFYFHAKANFWFDFISASQTIVPSFRFNAEFVDELLQYSINAQHQEGLKKLLDEKLIDEPCGAIYMRKILSLPFPLIFCETLILLDKSQIERDTLDMRWLDTIYNHKNLPRLYRALLLLSDEGLLVNPKINPYLERILRHPMPNALARSLVTIFELKDKFGRFQSKIYSALLNHTQPEDLAQFLISIQKAVPKFIFEACINDFITYWPHLRGNASLKSAWRHFKSEDYRAHLGILLDICQQNSGNLERSQLAVSQYFENVIMRKMAISEPMAYAPHLFRPKRTETALTAVLTSSVVGVGLTK